MGQRDFLEAIEDEFGEMRLRPEQYSALGLAYLGDDVYDLIIRTVVMEMGNGSVKNFHRITTGIVKAGAQAALMRVLEPILTEEERDIYHHGRNAKSASSAKNASITDYRIATGFEALLGYLYLKHDMKRALHLVKTGLEQTEQLPGTLRSGSGTMQEE